jgi:enamine deaminase RidA (YjgF/YER057c/UK114 family)
MNTLLKTKTKSVVFNQDRFDQAVVSFSRFDGENSTEFNLIITPDSGFSFSEQLTAIEKALKHFLKEQEMTDESVIFKRYFVSDYSNQTEIHDHMSNWCYVCATSVVQQVPLCGAKVVLWVVLLEGSVTRKSLNQNNLSLNRNGYSHLFSTQLFDEKAKGSSFGQTMEIFQDYMDTLQKQNLTLAENCIRTWIYVRDIDNNYAGMVNARNQIFISENLTRETHFIASTGIEGRHANTDALVLMDAYAVGGISPEQITFLKAPTHLNPTHEYGVAFERATTVDYGDRKQIFISGTASIDNCGQIVHPGDIAGQVKRTFENIKALLDEAGASIGDLTHLIVYVRDLADFPLIDQYIERHYTFIPRVVVLAPVCRPGWLIEIEGIAIKAVNNPKYNNY